MTHMLSFFLSLRSVGKTLQNRTVLLNSGTEQFAFQSPEVLVNMKIHGPCTLNQSLHQQSSGVCILTAPWEILLYVKLENFPARVEWQIRLWNRNQETWIVISVHLVTRYPARPIPCCLCFVFPLLLANRHSVMFVELKLIKHRLNHLSFRFQFLHL